MHFANMMSGWGGWWSWSMFVAMFAFWGGLIALILWGVSDLGRRPAATAPTFVNALETLKRRYSAGEIDREEFEQKKRDLS